MMVNIEIRDKVLWARLERPAVRNAMNLQMVEDLEQAFDTAEGDDNVRVVVLSGAAPAFCAGSDLKELGKLSLAELCRLEARKAALLRRLGLLTKPVVASVQGAAIGGGAFFAAACDVVIAAEDVRFQAMEVPNGWITPWGIHVLAERMSAKHAQLFCWGYQPVNATEALRIGLADHVASVEQLLEATETLAGQLAGLPSESVAATKRVVQSLATVDAERLDAHCNELFKQHCGTEASQATFRRFAK